MKKVLTLLAILLIITTLLVLFTLKNKEGIEYERTSEGYVITGIKNKAVEQLIIPSEIFGKPVIKIDTEAFRSCWNLKSVILPDTLRSIGHIAFKDCISLEAIIIPDSVELLGFNAFEGCTSLKAVHLGNGIKIISQEAFLNCENLNTVSIGKNTNQIYFSAFFGCMAISKIYVDDRNQVFSTRGDCLFSKDQSILIKYFPAGESTKEYEIPHTVQQIEELAFYGCSTLKSVMIPKEVVRIGQYAFTECEGITLYCQVSRQPETWDLFFNYANCPVVWEGYRG
jgi:hypothetical protein